MLIFLSINYTQISISDYNTAIIVLYYHADIMY